VVYTIESLQHSPMLCFSSQECGPIDYATFDKVLTFREA